MPSPHPTNPAPGADPTAKQLQLLRRLANASGQTFTTPATKAQASREIRRLCAVINATPVDELLADRLHEPERLHEVGSPYAATAIRAEETAGYGAHAHWTHSREGRS